MPGLSLLSFALANDGEYLLGTEEVRERRACVFDDVEVEEGTEEGYSAVEESCSCL
jgi:hypothetical protein